MTNQYQIVFLFTFLFIMVNNSGQDTISLQEKASGQENLYLKGQASTWINLNPDVDFPIFTGLRYIPEIHYNKNLKNDKLFDCEASLNGFASAGLHPFDSLHTDGKIKPYRVWCRYSGNQYEIRLGLQKINFGSAFMLRPLMWFDQVDPRDPLQLTDGVWGILGRYYFLNNANIWLWSLYGNEKSKTWEIGNTNQTCPEFGGRFQIPIPKGETAVTYHYRLADTREMDSTISSIPDIPESRIGWDGRWDIGIGLWVEGTWICKSKNIGKFTNQEILNAGLDYTFNIGNGLYTVVEHLIFSYDENPFTFSNTMSFSGTSLSYPLGMFDNLGAILYYDWKNRNVYSFANWKRQFNKISLYFMAYINPEKYRIPMQGETGTLFSGKGIQVMFVYNH